MKLVEFVIASVLLALTPGPDVLLVLTTSALGGFRKGFRLALGLTSGIVFHTCVVALGVAALVVANPVLFNAVKYAGAFYLLYLGISGIVKSHRKTAHASVDGLAGDDRRIYLRGVMMNILNPKVALFFLALFPQFLDPSSNVAVGSLILGGVFACVTIVVFGMVAGLSGYFGKKLNLLAIAPKKIAYIQLGVYVIIIGWLLFGM